MADYLVDDAGNRLVDDSGNYLVTDEPVEPRAGLKNLNRTLSGVSA
jgi:hypothetical protein